ncbi:FecR family protein [Mucilaginibacter paludis]|uniref:Anti-FecI sigma factor, FecR n=1 Tax=Mucilaginibacter paludis DSM 18603 TaxID=714943 RepID=H1Y924_9SPHI|nr:FecR domain-containing protein [Mucilaginibacter paludis]EHQ29062.1 anti-FecI sigma factor, FecR [Mucilaginibacter paludis DSM 18603]
MPHITPEEKEKFEQLYQQMRKGKDLFAEEILLSEDIAELDETELINDQIDMDAAFARQKERQLNKRRIYTQAQRKELLALFQPLILRVAAVLFLGLGFAWWLLNKPLRISGQQNAEQKWQTISNSGGGTSNIHFPDGTYVRLGPQSTIIYPVSFSETERRVKLSGEGYFEVAKDTLHPFIVESQNVETKVLGTHFMIEAYPKDDHVSVSLIEGRVQVTRDNARSILLPSQQIVYNAANREGKISIMDQVTANALVKDHIVFNSLPLGDVAIKLSRIYNVKFQFKTEKLKKLKVTGEFEKIPLKEIMDMLTSSQHISYHTDAERHTIQFLPIHR